jgi:hypothetical protein
MHSSFFKGLHRFNELSGTSPGNSYLIYGGDQNYPTAEAHVRSWDNLPQF